MINKWCKKRKSGFKSGLYPIFLTIIGMKGQPDQSYLEEKVMEYCLPAQVLNSHHLLTLVKNTLMKIKTWKSVLTATRHLVLLREASDALVPEDKTSGTIHKDTRTTESTGSS